MDFGTDDIINNTIGGVPIEIIKEKIAEMIDNGLLF